MNAKLARRGLRFPLPRKLPPMSRSMLILISLTSAIALTAATILTSRAWARRHSPVHAAKPRLPGRATLGAHTLVGQEDGRADTVAQTRPMMTEPRGSSFVAFNAGYVTNTAGPVDNKGNSWTLFGEPVIYAGYEGRFDVKAYLVLDGKGGPEHRVRIEKPGNPYGELTMPVVEIRDAGRLVDSAHNYAPKGKLLACGSVSTDGPALLVAFWWGDGLGLRHSAVPDNGFEVIDLFTDLPEQSGVQCVVAVREVESSGSYNVNWSSTPEQGAPLWLFAFAHERADGASRDR